MMNFHRHGWTLAAAFTALAFTSQARANQDVELLFDGGWETQLNTAATDAGKSAFNSTEIGEIETLILSELNRIYADYDLMSFASVESASGGANDTVIDFGATTGSSTTLGNAGLDLGNLTANQTVNVFSANFDFFIDESLSRPDQITQIGTGLAGTAAHELAHSFGVRHGAAYGVSGITTANYNNTLGLQNASIIATGSTGLDEAGRETQRNLSTWSKVVLDAAGGLSSVIASSTPLVTGNVDTVFESGGDAGDTAGTAQALSTITGPTSGLDTALVFGSVDGASDTDYFSLEVDEAGYLSAGIWSLDRWAAAVDTSLVIYDTDGSTILFTQETNEYDDNVYGDAAGVNGSEDPLLLNLLLDSAGTYFIRVLNVASITNGDDYSLLLSFEVPEPTTALLLTTLLLATAHRRRRA